MRAGHVGIARSSPDFDHVLVVNQILGGQFTSRLNESLREERGLTYGVRSSFDCRRRPGPFTISASVQTEKVGEALEEIRIELEAISGGRPPTQAELDDARRSLIEGQPRHFETPGALVNRFASLVIHGLPVDHEAGFRDAWLQINRRLGRSPRPHATSFRARSWRSSSPTPRGSSTSSRASTGLRWRPKARKLPENILRAARRTGGLERDSYNGRNSECAPLAVEFRNRPETTRMRRMAGTSRVVAWLRTVSQDLVRLWQGEYDADDAAKRPVLGHELSAARPPAPDSRLHDPVPATPAQPMRTFESSIVDTELGDVTSLAPGQAVG